MCCGLDRVFTTLHVLWACVYVCCGAVQIVTGIFFLISLPAIKLICNIWAGSWNVLAGIGSGMLACFSRANPRRQERLLYVSISILVCNTVNAVITEWTFWHHKELFQQEEQLQQETTPTTETNEGFVNIVTCARITTGIAAATVLLVAFLDSQLTFCSIDATKSKTRSKGKGKKAPSSHEQVSDIEYIIPRQKTNNSRPANTTYSQSWVFESENQIHQNNIATSPYLKLDTEIILNGNHEKITAPNEKRVSQTETVIISNPVVHIEEASDENSQNSDRKLCYMKSFSRSPSPAVLSAASSQISLNNQNSEKIYECLEKLTEPSVYRNRLNTALSIQNEEQTTTKTTVKTIKMEKPNQKIENVSPRTSTGQYASLMVELEQKLTKKDKVLSSEKVSTESSQPVSEKDFKSSDQDFSKELEAALQLIQDLESPNTADTPSESGKDNCNRPLAVWRNSDCASDKTLSAVGSFAELTSPLAEISDRRPSLNSKLLLPSILIHSESQSTSGYSSPTRKNWSATSSVDLEETITNFTIKNTSSSAVISLFTPHDTQPLPQTQTQTLPNKSVTVIKLNDSLDLGCTDLENNNVIFTTKDFIDKNNQVRRSASTTSTLSPWNVKSLLRKKKNIPALPPELESAIIKSESLAHLSESELLERCERNREIQRRIEQRVQQQLGQMTESNC